MENFAELVPQGLGIQSNKEGEVRIYHGDAPRLLDPYDYQGFQYKALSLPAFVSLVKAKGTQESAVVFHGDDRFFAILDDTIKNREQDTVAYCYETSVIYKEFAKILQGGAAFAVPEFVRFLKHRTDKEIPDLEKLTYGVKNFKYVQSMSGDFSFNSRNDYTFSIKASGVEETLKIPQSFVANIEIFKESGFVQEMEIEIEIKIPKSPDEEPIFLLTCPKFTTHMDEAKKKLANDLVSQLDGWLVVAGTPRVSSDLRANFSVRNNSLIGGKS